MAGEASLPSRPANANYNDRAWICIQGPSDSKVSAIAGRARDADRIDCRARKGLIVDKTDYAQLAYEMEHLLKNRLTQDSS